MVTCHKRTFLGKKKNRKHFLKFPTYQIRFAAAKLVSDSDITSFHLCQDKEYSVLGLVQTIERPIKKH